MCEMKELKIRIKKAGLSRKKLAKMLNVSYQMLNYWLNSFGDMPKHISNDIELILKNEEKN